MTKKEKEREKDKEEKDKEEKEQIVIFWGNALDVSVIFSGSIHRKMFTFVKLEPRPTAIL